MAWNFSTVPSQYKASGFAHRSFRPDAVRYMSVDTAIIDPR